MSELRIDPTVADWLEEGPSQGPADARQRALEATRSVHQRPAWQLPRRWLPRRVADVELALPLPAGVTIILILSLLLLIALAASFSGARPTIRLPMGPSADALVAYADDGAVYVSRLDGSERREISVGVEGAGSPIFSPAGNSVAFVASSAPDSAGGPLMVAPVDGSEAAVEVSDGMVVLPSAVPQISWSPDGSGIAFAAERDGVSAIFVAAADGSGVTRLTDTSAHRDLPSWSPDGDWIAYRTIDPDGERRHLESIRPDGSETQHFATVVAGDADLSRLEWSPANDSLLYAMNVGYGTQDSVVIDHHFGHTAIPWSEGLGGAFDGGPSYAPDGLRMAFLTASDGLIVADFDPTGPDYEGELVRLGHVLDCWVDWSPDGTALFGGSPGDCSGTVVVPLDDPEAAITLPGSGVASWQPLEP